MNYNNYVAFIEVSPSNQTVRIGEWNNLSYEVQCSQSEYITWFVQANGYTLPLFDSVLNGLKVQSYPESALCSKSHVLKRETHSVALMLSYELNDLPLMIYCAVISVCKKNDLHCTPYSCYSENAYLYVQGTRIWKMHKTKSH